MSLLFGYASFCQVRFFAEVSEGPLLASRSIQIQYVAEGAMSMENFEVKEMKGWLLLDSFTHYSKIAERKKTAGPTSIVKVLVVMAPSQGSYWIPEASAMINGRPMKTKSFEVKLKSGEEDSPKSLTLSVPTEANSVLGPRENIDQKIREHVFIRVETSKQICTTGEDITVTYKLYSDIEARSLVLKRPAFPGGSVLEMVDRYDSTAEVELLDGKPYYVNLIRKVHLFPLQSGELTLDDAEVLCTANMRRGEQKISRTLNLHARPGSLMVVDPPLKEKPVGYSGGVGKFNISLSASDSQPLPRSLIKIQVRILGQGNLPLLPNPVIQWPSGLKAGEPETKEVYDAYRFPLTGYKEFEYTLTVPDTGTIQLKPLSFNFYDPSQKRYATVVSGGLVIKVTNDSIKDGANVRPLEQKGWPLQYYWFSGVLVLILVVLAHQFRLDRKERLNTQLMAMQEVTTLPIKDYLLEARMAFYKEDEASFPKLLLSGCWNFYEEAWDLSVAQHQKPVLESMMKEKGFSSETIQAMMELLIACEWLVYSPREVSQQICLELLKEADRLMEIQQQSINP